MQENRAWNRLKEEELIETLKLMEASEIYPAKAQKVYEALKDKYDAKDLPSVRTVGRSLRNLLGKSDEELDEITDENGIGIVDKGKYNLGFKKAKKKGTYIIGYWYDEKDGEEGASSKYLARFLSDAVIYSKVLNPEYKPEYYSSLQRLFGTGQVKELNEFSRKIVDLKPYSAEGGIDVMENILIVQKAIDMQKKIEFKLGVYRYTSDGTIELDIENSNVRCVSPLQIMMSNGRYYVIAKNERKSTTQDFLFYRIDLMEEIEIKETKRRDVQGQVEWKNPQKFLISNPFFYSGEKEDIVIGFEEQQITQVVDWFGTEENGLFECLGTYYMEKTEKGKTSTVEVEMVKLKFPKVNVMAFSFWVMQYMDCVEVLEGELLKKILKERMKWALENRIK